MQPIPFPNLRTPSDWVKVPPAPSSQPGAAPEPPLLPPSEPAPPLAPIGHPLFPTGLPGEIAPPPAEEGQKGPPPLPGTLQNSEELLLEALRPAAAGPVEGGLRPASFAPLWDASTFLHQAAKLASGDPERELVLSAARLIEKFRAWDELLQSRRHNLYKA